MDKAPKKTFVGSEAALEGGQAVNLEQGQSTPPYLEALGTLPENATRDDVIDTFTARQTELAETAEGTQAQQGFNVEMLAKQSEQADAERDLTVLTEAWTEFGGDDILDAQKAVDALDFKSTANDRVEATTRLRDAKNAFHTNYQETQQPNNAEATDETDATDGELIPITRPNYEARRQAIIDSTPDKSDKLVPITRPAVKKYNQQQEDLAPAEAPDHSEVDSSYDTADTPIAGIDATADARENWHKMMTAEREATAEVSTHRSRELGAAAVDLLSDSVVVAEYRKNRDKRRSLFATMRGSFQEWRVGKDHRNMQKAHAKELKAFDKEAKKARALQDAEDKATIKGAGREAALNDKLFEKRLKAEAKLKAKQDSKVESFQNRETGRLERRKAIGRAAAKASLFFSR